MALYLGAGRERDQFSIDSPCLLYCGLREWEQLDILDMLNADISTYLYIKVFIFVALSINVHSQNQITYLPLKTCKSLHQKLTDLNR